MTIRDIPRFGERLRMIEEAWLREDGRALPVPALYGQGFTLGIVAGVEWASEQADREPSADLPANVTFQGDTSAESRGITHSADREPSDAEVEAAADAIVEASFGQELPEAPIDLARAALLAAQQVRRG